jgi:hypothetical protein
VGRQVDDAEFQVRAFDVGDHLVASPSHDVHGHARELGAEAIQDFRQKKDKHGRALADSQRSRPQIAQLARLRGRMADVQVHPAGKADQQFAGLRQFHVPGRPAPEGAPPPLVRAGGPAGGRPSARYSGLPA